MPIIFLGGEGAGGLVLCFTEVLLSLERGAWNDAKKNKDMYREAWNGVRQNNNRRKNNARWYDVSRPY